MKLLSAAPASFLSVACDLHDAAGAVVGAGVVVVVLVWAAAPQARARPAASETAATAMERGEAGDRWWGAQSVVNAGVAVAGGISTSTALAMASAARLSILQ